MEILPVKRGGFFADSTVICRYILAKNKALHIFMYCEVNGPSVAKK